MTASAAQVVPRPVHRDGGRRNGVRAHRVAARADPRRAQRHCVHRRRRVGTVHFARAGDASASGRRTRHGPPLRHVQHDRDARGVARRPACPRRLVSARPARLSARRGRRSGRDQPSFGTRSSSRFGRAAPSRSHRSIAPAASSSACRPGSRSTASQAGSFPRPSSPTCSRGGMAPRRRRSRSSSSRSESSRTSFQLSDRLRLESACCGRWCSRICPRTCC